MNRHPGQDRGFPDTMAGADGDTIVVLERVQHIALPWLRLGVEHFHDERDGVCAPLLDAVLEPFKDLFGPSPPSRRWALRVRAAGCTLHGSYHS